MEEEYIDYIVKQYFKDENYYVKQESSGMNNTTKFLCVGDKKYIFGFEESYGYLAGEFVRDKDAVIASMLIAEMTLYYKEKGMSLYDALIDLYKEFGFFKEDLISIELKGKEGQEKIAACIDSLRNNPIKKVLGVKVKT